MAETVGKRCVSAIAALTKEGILCLEVVRGTASNSYIIVVWAVWDVSAPARRRGLINPYSLNCYSINHL